MWLEGEWMGLDGVRLNEWEMEWVMGELICGGGLMGGLTGG